jgi:hypothetical protein
MNMSYLSSHPEGCSSCNPSVVTLKMKFKRRHVRSYEHDFYLEQCGENILQK